MIRYALNCEHGHAFESWFQNSAAYDKQAKRALVTCPVCGSAKVEKAIMAPRLARTEPGEPVEARPAPPLHLLIRRHCFSAVSVRHLTPPASPPAHERGRRRRRDTSNAAWRD